jgi:aryl-alcohol dehydrogenase
MKSTAAVAHSLRSPFVVEEVDLPDLQHTDVPVRIVAVGICHTDIGSRGGQLPASFPAIFGHEGAGVVERVGDQGQEGDVGGSRRARSGSRRDM